MDTLPPSNPIVIHSYPVRQYARPLPCDNVGWLWLVIAASLVVGLLAGCAP